MNKKFLSLILTVAMVLCLFPSAAFAAEEITHSCNSAKGVYCLVCDLAEKINALPAAEEITVDNAAAVTEQIHAIDRLKVEIDYDGTEYEELMTMVESGNDGSGYGTDVPLRYMEAVEAVRLLGGNSLYISKSFVASDGSEVNVDNAEVKVLVTNTDTGVSQTLTLSTMDYIAGSLSADADFYSADADGWTYKYILPAGTYRIEEVSYSGATVNGEEFVTTEVTYNGTAGTDGCLVTLAEGASDTVEVGNVNRPVHHVDAKDSEGNSLSGVSMSINGNDTDFSHTWTTDGEQTDLTLVDNNSYTLTVNSVPSGYTMPNPASVTFTVGDESGFNDPFVLTSSEYNEYTIDVTIPTVSGAAVTINFVDRDGNAIEVDGDYSHGTTDEDGDGSIDMVHIDNLEKASSYKMENLADGIYNILVYNVYTAGYASGGFIEFRIKDGVIVEEYDAETETYTPGSNSHTILEWNTDSITVEVASIMYDFSVSVMGIDAALPYEVKDADGNAIAWSYTEEVENPESGSVHLAPGTYKMYALTYSNLASLIKFPAEDKYVEFTVNADYTITVNSSEYDTELEDFGGSYWLTWYLEPQETVTVTAKIETSNGSNLAEGTVITLYVETGLDEETGERWYDEVQSITVPTDSNTYTHTWTVSAYHSETDEYGENKLVENAYEVRGMDADGNEFYFSESEEGNVWTATVAGSAIEAEFYTMADAGYYAETSESGEKTGVIALNAQVVNLADISDYIVGYGMFIYKGSQLYDVRIDTIDSEDKSRLESDEGYYHAIVNNIAEADFETVFSGRPFVVVKIGGEYKWLTGEDISASVMEYNKWLGEVNPY